MIDLRNEDCFEFLRKIEDNSIDLILIDPPYEVSRDTNFDKGDLTGRDVDRFRISNDFGEWDYNFKGLNVVIQHSYRILRKGGTIITFYDLWKLSALKIYYERYGFTQLRFLEWVKTNPVPINSKLNYLTNAREIAILGVKDGKPIFNSEYDNGIYEYPICHDDMRFHPTQKPVDLIEDIIEKHSNKGDKVLDCFSGSGTTALACFNTQRDFIGCDIDESYYKKSIQRLILSGALDCEWV